MHLGVDTVWISPIYPLSMAEFGYDVAGHCAVDPFFGSLANFDRLIAETRARGLRILPVKGKPFRPKHDRGGPEAPVCSGRFRDSYLRLFSFPSPHVTQFPRRR